MNLHDIVKRKDQIMVVDAGMVEPIHRSGVDGFMGARVGPATRLRFVDLSRYTSLKLGAPLGWQVVEGEADIVVSDDEIVVRSEGGAVIRSSRFSESRSHIFPFAIGDGLEVGPGRNPHIKPSEQTRVRYLEEVGKDEWLARYRLELNADSDQMWRNYVRGDARYLDGIRKEHLDFIYSSHVFEHLMNPIGVLGNWSARLKSGGSVLAVVPDCRYCFDLRQEPSTLAEMEAEFVARQWLPRREKYEKWCNGTAIGEEPESYIERKYSIHFHYYTPSIFGQLAAKTMERGMFSHFGIWCAPNKKDFAIRLVK